MSDLSIDLYSIETEQALIGSLLTDPDAIPQIMGVINAEDFHDHRHQYIYTAIMAIGCNADLLTVATELDRRGTLNDSGGEIYLTQLLGEVPTALHAEQYAKDIANLALRRRLRNHALPNIAKAASDLSQPSDELLDMAQRELIKATGTAIAGIKPMNTVLSEFYSQYEAKAAGNALTGIRSSISPLDEKTRGWRPGRLITIAGRPGTGKSALMAQFAAHAAMKQQKRVAFFTAEMGETEVIERIVGNFAGLNMSKPNTHTPDDMLKVVATQTQIAKSGLIVAYIAGWTPARIIAECERIRTTKGLDLVVIDYLQILNVPQGKGETRDMSLSAATRQFKQSAGKMGVPIILGAQLNRDAVNGEPQLHQLRETGGLENDSDAVLMLHDVSSMEQPNLLNAYIRKNRDGETGKIELYFNKPHQRISAIAK
jgi:replicative DNA helicase